MSALFYRSVPMTMRSKPLLTGDPASGNLTLAEPNRGVGPAPCAGVEVKSTGFRVVAKAEQNGSQSIRYPTCLVFFA